MLPPNSLFLWEKTPSFTLHFLWKGKNIHRQSDCFRRVVVSYPSSTLVNEFKGSGVKDKPFYNLVLLGLLILFSVSFFYAARCTPLSVSKLLHIFTSNLDCYMCLWTCTECFSFTTEQLQVALTPHNLRGLWNRKVKKMWVPQN